MSQSVLVDWQTLLPLNASLVVGNYMLLASSCLIYYDYVITLATEVRVFWRCHLSRASFFYLFIRYGFLVNAVIILLSNVRMSPHSWPTMTNESCRIFYDLFVSINWLNFATVSAFVAMRMYAVFGGNWPIAVGIFLLGLLNPNAINPTMLYRLKVQASPWPVWGCELYMQDDSDNFIFFASQDLPIIISAVNIVYELLCLVLTAWKTLGAYRSQHRSDNPATLTSLLFRDGSLYFVVMTALSSANIVCALVPGVPSNIQVNSVFGRVLTPILTTRFIAHLQQFERKDDFESPCLTAVSGPPCCRTYTTGRLFTSVGPPISDASAIGYD
ncbi:hypothetical protein C8Q79DRAFT_520167 [Trametes meyenii]|nr:hypothetical protein C8Q79DRAFT_520167 [Trametes meyenii]